ncbi:MAG: sigma 54-interacting transcriptional regulator [Bacillota bacterium]|nr:sigma 54-interacting transcriptional regulator [Bacillota bacterium]
MRVRDVMSAVRGTLHPWDSLEGALRLFGDAKADGVPVVDGQGKLVGILTRSHFYRALLQGCSLQEAVDFHMSAAVVAIGADASVDTVLDQVRSIRVGQVVVCEQDGRPVGMLTKVDVIRLLLRETDFLTGELLGVLEAMHAGVVAVDREGRVTLVNAAATVLLGRTRSQLVGRAVAEPMPHAPLSAVLSTGEPVLGRRLELGNGRRVIVNTTPIRLGEQVMGAIAVIEDLTDYEAVARELETTRRLQETLETVLETAYDGIAVVDEEGVLTMVNQAMADFLGVRREDVLGKHCSQVLEGTHLPEVLRRGVGEYARVENIRGRRYVVSRFPIARDGRVVGAVEKIIFRNLEELRRLARRLDVLEGQVAYYKGELERSGGARYSLDDIVGASEAMQRLKREVERIAQGSSTVLILGESGTGKELLAHAVHRSSPRRYGPFVKVNCAAVPEELLESEFFGYAEGAFTGARKGGKPGKFELASGGTLFLDEVGDMSPALQAKILNVLQDREIVRVGGTGAIPVDVRVVAASNRDLKALVRQGRFREDLYYRLNVVCLHVPPLRDRREDILPLARHFLARYASLAGIRLPEISTQAAEAMLRHDWPGNVRELENAIERALNLELGDTLEAWHLPDAVAGGPALPDPGRSGTAHRFSSAPIRDTLREAESLAISRALEQAGGNKALAARLLGMSRSRLYEKIKRYGIT